MKYRPGTFLLLLLLGVLLTTCEEPIEPDEQFVRIHFRYGFRDELNTFDNTYHKDLVLDGVISAEFWFTTEEQESILIQLETHRFFALPDTVRTTPSDTAVIISPDPGIQSLRIQFEERDHTVSWYFHSLPTDSPDGISISTIRDYLIDLIESKPAYQSLPPARGGYI